MTGMLQPQPTPPPRPWLAIAVVVALLIVAGNIVAYILYQRTGGSNPPKVVASVEAPPDEAPPPKATTTSALAEEQREAGVRAMRNGHYAKAIASFEAAMKLDPNLGDAALLLDVAKRLQAADEEAGEAAPPREVATNDVEPAEARTVEPAPTTRRRRVRRATPPKRKRRVEREVEVEPESGILAVTTEPAALTVEIDDLEPMTTPVEVELDPGPHDVTILKDGAVLESRRISVVADQRTKMERDFVDRLARADAPPPPPTAAAVVAPPPPPKDGVSRDGELDLVALIDRDAPKATEARATTEAPPPPSEGPKLTPTAQGSPRLVVFWPGRTSSSLQQSMRSEMNGVDVHVVTRTGDLKRALTSPTDAVMASPYVLRSNGLAPTMSAKSTASGRYLAVAFARAPVKARIAGQTVGVVDELGRNAMPGFVQKLLGSDSPPPLRRVTKVEDLLPLLQFEIAKTVLVKERDFPILEGRTKQKLYTLPLSADGTPLAVAFADGSRKSVVERAVRGMGNQSKQSLGVDSWVTR